MRSITAWLTVLALAASAAAGEVSFKQKPTVRQQGGATVIEFELAAPADVEVAVVDGKGEVVRHLAAGLVGGEKAAPPLKPARLAQSLRWDRTDDGGKPVAGKVTVRVRAGLTATLGKVVGEPARTVGRIYGLATDEKGNLYVASGGVYASTPVFSIKVFDRAGQYVRTILPMPASLSVDRAAEYGTARAIDGRLTPGNFNPLVPYVQKGGIVAFLGNQVRDGVLWLLNTEGRICRIRAIDGAPITWKSGVRSVGPSGGPMCWAVSPDNKTLYLAGWWNTRSKKGDGVVKKVDPATGQADDFISIEPTGNKAWVNEPNGWYHFKNWGRKNGLAALHGLAVDKQNRLYVCDRVGQRLAAYDADGKPAGSTPIDFPDIVSLSPTDETVYVATRKVIKGYQAINEFRVVKLSKAIDGQVLAEVTLKGNNAPVMAVDATAAPAVIWLSNVGPKGGKLVRIEDRGDTLVVTGELNDRLGAFKPIVKIWADPMTDDVYVNDGWSGLSKYGGRTGQGGPIAITAIDLAVGPDRNLYLYGRKGWNEPIYRCDLDFKPVPFSGTGKPTTSDTTATKKDPKTGEVKAMPVYGRYGCGWSNKGLHVAADGRIYVRCMYDWSKYFVTVFKPDGTAERHDRIQGGIIGPLDTGSGGIRVDRDGYLYVGTNGHPAGMGRAHPFKGCVVKVKPTGGGVVPVKRPKKGEKPEPVDESKGILLPGYLFEGAVTAYPDLAPRQSRGCVCKEARFDLDGYGRLYVPDVLDFCIRVYDNAGNVIAKLGHYGNVDSAGSGSTVPQPEIPLGWPLTCGVNRADRLYVGDVLNQRIVRVDLGYAAEESVPAE